LFYVFNDYYNEKNVLFVTNDDLVFGLGVNIKGCLGLGHNSAVHSPQLIPQLCHKSVQQFINAFDFVLAFTQDNQIYSLGQNSRGQLARDVPESGVYLKPEIISYFTYKNIQQIIVVIKHSLALTSDGRCMDGVEIVRDR